MLRSVCIKRKYRENRQRVNALLPMSHYQLSKINIWEEIHNLTEVLAEMWEIWKYGFIKNLREFELLRVNQGHIQDDVCGKEKKSQQLKEVSKGSVTKVDFRMRCKMASQTCFSPINCAVCHLFNMFTG